MRLVGATVLLSLATTAFAHDAAVGVVKERMELMKDLAAVLKRMDPMFRGHAPYRAEQVRAAAQAIESHAHRIPRLFPSGSGGHASEARPEIWREWTGFNAQVEALRAFAAALAKAADRGLGAQDASPVPSVTDRAPEPWALRVMSPRQLFAGLTDTCRSCHERFRRKN